VGLTVSSFNSVSLEPPLVLWSLAHSASSMAVFQACTHYAVHVLGDDQGELAHRFATRGIDRFAQTPTRPGPTGVPLLLGCIAHFECRNRSQHQEGDHVVFVGEVLHCTRTASARPPLLYQAGQLHMGGRLHVGS
jgi:flavin reductase (DIM6/NTAB) family NADH-FMN oxidoreductase RutF